MDRTYKGVEGGKNAEYYYLIFNEEVDSNEVEEWCQGTFQGKWFYFDAKKICGTNYLMVYDDSDYMLAKLRWAFR